MTELRFLVGIPASGKSTFAKEILKDNNYVLVSSDSYREKIYGSEEIQGNKNELFEIINKDIIQYLMDGKSVIFDATNIDLKKRMELIKKINSKVSDIYITAQVVATQYKICLENNRKRTRFVPEFVIKRMYENFTFPQNFEGIHNVFIRYDYDKYDYRQEWLEELMDDFNQDNPHHSSTLGQHTLKVFENILTVAPDNHRLQLAAKFHDIGKLYTKTYKDSKGNQKDFASYYNHEQVSTYESMFYLKEKNIQNFDMFYILGLIQFHMRLYGINSDKSRDKLINLIGRQMYEDLILLNDADKNGK